MTAANSGIAKRLDARATVAPSLINHGAQFRNTQISAAVR
jgi:hypothetical protein